MAAARARRPTVIRGGFGIGYGVVYQGEAAVNLLGGELTAAALRAAAPLVSPMLGPIMSRKRAASAIPRSSKRSCAGRTCCDQPQLFLRARSPIRALTHYAVVDVFATRAQQSGLPLQGASSYALRHAFAMRLLHRGVGVRAIGDLLGHRSLESTCVYLRIDTDMLRAVALPVPAVAAS